MLTVQYNEKVDDESFKKSQPKTRSQSCVAIARVKYSVELFLIMMRKQILKVWKSFCNLKSKLY